MFQIDMYVFALFLVYENPLFRMVQSLLQQSALLRERLGKLKLFCVSDCALNLLPCSASIRLSNSNKRFLFVCVGYISKY